MVLPGHYPLHFCNVVGDETECSPETREDIGQSFLYETDEQFEDLSKQKRKNGKNY